MTVTVVNDRCPDCGHHERYCGPTIMNGRHLMCCAAQVARHNAMIAEGKTVHYIAPEASNAR